MSQQLRPFPAFLDESLTKSLFYGREASKTEYEYSTAGYGLYSLLPRDRLDQWVLVDSAQEGARVLGDGLVVGRRGAPGSRKAGICTDV